MDENVRFLKGTETSFNALRKQVEDPNSNVKYQPGAFYLVIDDTYKQDGVTPNNRDTFGKPSRLYYGVSETVIAPVNQGITTVETQNDLPKGDALAKIPHGSFYYVVKDNILAIANGNGWVQANVDTTLDTTNSDYNLSEIPIVNGTINKDFLEHSPGKKLDETETTFNDVLGKNVTSLLRYVSNIKDTAGNIIPQHLYMGSTGPIKLRQETITWKGNGVDSKGNIVPDGADYTKPVLYIEGTDISYDLGIIYDPKKNKELDLKLSKTEKGTGLDAPTQAGGSQPITTDVSTLKIKGGTNISFTKNEDDSSYSIVNDGKISDISVTTETQVDEPLGSGDTIKKDNDGFKVTLKSNMVEGGETLTTAFDPIIKIGNENLDKNKLHFNNGIANLPVYTIDEVDKIYRDLNAMVYRGVVFVEPNDTLKVNTDKGKDYIDETKLHNGDIYICKEVYTPVDGQAPTFKGGVIKVGDLIICQGTENEDKDGYINGEVTWQIIPSGDEPITSFATEIKDTVIDDTGNITNNLYKKAWFVSSIGDNEALEYGITGDNEVEVSTVVTHSPIDNRATVTGTVGHTTAAINNTKVKMNNQNLPETDHDGNPIYIPSQITFEKNGDNTTGAKKLTVPFYDIAEISKYGHIKTYEKKELVIEDTHADLSAGMATTMEPIDDPASPLATVSITTTLNKDNNEEDIKLSPFKVASKTIAVTCVNPAVDDQKVVAEIEKLKNSTDVNRKEKIAALSVPTVQLEMVWGSF